MKWRFWLSRHSSPIDDCSTVEPLLSLFCDDMVSPGEARRVESHLSACEDCRRALSWMQATQAVLSERAVAVPPPDLRARIARAIAETEQPAVVARVRPARRPLVLRPVFLTAAVAATVAALGVFVEHPQTINRTGSAPPLVVAETHPRAPEANPPVKKAAAAHTLPPRVAVAPPRAPRSAADSRLPAVRHATGAGITRVADAARNPAPSVETAPAAGKPHAPVPAHPAQSSLVASGLTIKPHASPVRPTATGKSVVEAMLPHKPLAGPSETLVTPSPELAAPAPTPGEAAQPEVTHVAAAFPAAKPPVHEQILSSVVARLATFKAANSDLKVYRDSNVRVQTAAYNFEPKFVQAPINYTPTSLAANDSPRAH